jgi:hypothetical protein
MAIIRAAQSGNWSSTSTWIGGVVPTSVDDAVSNNFNITMDVSTTALSLRNDTSGSATAGGQFQFSVAGVSVTLTGSTPMLAGGTVTVLVLVNNSTGTVNITTTSSILIGTSTTNMISHTSAGAFTLTLPLLTNNGGNVPAVFTRSGTGTLTINGNVSAGNNGAATNQAINNTGTGTINIIGSVTGGISSNNTQGILNTNSSATINVNGGVFGGAVAGVGNQAINSTGPVNITAGSVTAQGAAIAISCSNTVTVNGTVTSNGSGAAISAVAAATSITVTGNVIVGAASTANVIVSTNAGASVTLIGNFTNRAGRQAIYCQTIFLSNAVTNALTYNTPGGSSRTLYSDDTFPNLPSTDNVRFNTTYGPGSGSTGSLVVPSPATVLLGVPTDNTTGTLLMTPADFITELNTSTTAVAVRLQNCATVATTGDQVASYGV